MKLDAGKVRFGIIGCGIIADVHARVVALLSEAELIGVTDVNREHAKRFAARHHCRAYESIEALLRDDKIDAVCICTPSGLHAEQAIQTARAGKHVFVEKPMALKLDDVDRMVTVCEENEVLLSTVFPRRMSPHARFARKFIQDGRLGKLSLCSAYVKIYRDQAYYDSAGWRGTWKMDGGGVMMNQGIHTVDLLQWLVGPVVSLSGKAKTVLRSIEVEDTAAAILQFENGAMGVLEMTTTAHPSKGQRLEIHGNKGTLVIEEDHIVALEIEGEEAVKLPPLDDFKVVPDGHLLQLKDFAEAIQDGRMPIVPGTAGRHSLAIILGTYTSSSLGREVVLPDM
ncbi:Gfo/Idh/MocA family protein [Marinicrinis lubricantis]|uniref:Gfo/Idh/MocA family protein n=1 Tax=Marinicrinis lubricantis TaxID=2086470 RepID=A0ABW1IPB6_9BACL